RTVRKVVGDILRDQADGVLEGFAGSEVVPGEDAEDDSLSWSFQDPDIIPDVGQEVAGLVRDRVAGDVAWYPRTIQLAAHDAQHEIGRRFIDQCAALHHLEQPAHLPRRREAERMFPLPVELFGGWRRAQCGKPL